MRIHEQNRKWFTDAQAQGVNIWYNETFGGDDVCEIKIMKVKITIIVSSWVYRIEVSRNPEIISLTALIACNAIVELWTD